jgi:tetratricopeptide (TPR) repeat protein
MALSFAPEHALAHLCMGRVQINTNRAVQGIAECERALALNRNLAGAHAMIGVAKIYIGHAEETEAHIHEALRLSPRDTNANLWMAVTGLSKLYLGREEEAVALLLRSIEIKRNFPQALFFWLASAFAHLGRYSDARTAAECGLALNPSFTIARQRVALSDNPTFQKQRERIFDGMRQAGVPEG